MIAFPMEFFGRRMTLATISIPYVLGFYLMGLSYYVNWTPLLFIGRVITGLLTGASAPTSQIYVIPLFLSNLIGRVKLYLFN
jgi:facilitated trehalose transporter